MEKYPEEKAYFVLCNVAAGLRLAYVAQNAFHHLEEHMQETLTLYLMWRFVGNDGKVSIEFRLMRKLKASNGTKDNTLTMFAERYLVKKAYIGLSYETMKFAFPEPGPVEGNPTIVDVNLTVCVAVIGANGAGKYTVVRKTAGKESIVFMSDDLSVDEVFIRSVKWAHRWCVRQRV